jgi:uncharacterized protein YacL
MRLILLWGLGLGLATVVIDVIAGEAARNINDTDLAAAINLVDQLIGFVLYGWVGYRVARIVRELRQGLEAAVLAGVIAGALGIVYNLVRPTQDFGTTEAVELLAWNIVAAASAGSVGAWLATMRRPEAPSR